MKYCLCNIFLACVYFTIVQHYLHSCTSWGFFFLSRKFPYLFAKQTKCNNMNTDTKWLNLQIFCFFCPSCCWCVSFSINAPIFSAMCNEKVKTKWFYTHRIFSGIALCVCVFFFLWKRKPIWECPPLSILRFFFRFFLDNEYMLLVGIVYRTDFSRSCHLILNTICLWFVLYEKRKSGEKWEQKWQLEDEYRRNDVEITVNGRKKKCSNL